MHEPRLDALTARLPRRLAACVVWLRRPTSRWTRLPAGGLLMVCGLFGFLPVLGVWMLPLGLAILADGIAIFRRGRTRVLDWLERRRPHWFKPQVS